MSTFTTGAINALKQAYPYHEAEIATYVSGMYYTEMTAALEVRIRGSVHRAEPDTNSGLSWELDSVMPPEAMVRRVLRTVTDILGSDAPNLRESLTRVVHAMDMREYLSEWMTQTLENEMAMRAAQKGGEE